MTIEINDASFKSEVTDSAIPVLVDFWAPWCGPCKMIAPVLDEIANEYDGKVKVVKINIDENQTTGQFRFRSFRRWPGLHDVRLYVR